MKFEINIANQDLNKSGIYKITNNITDEIYIGSTKNFQKRALCHKRAMLHRKHNRKINNLIKSYPSIIFSMSIVEITNNYREIEYEYIKKYNCVKNGLNILENEEDFRNVYKFKEKIINKNKIHFLKPIKCTFSLKAEYKNKKSIHNFIMKLGKNKKHRSNLSYLENLLFLPN